MAYVYLLDLYNFIDQRLAQTASALKEAEGDIGETSFQNGRIAALSDFKAFLKQDFHPKLPRRIRESL